MPAGKALIRGGSGVSPDLSRIDVKALTARFIKRGHNAPTDARAVDLSTHLLDELALMVAYERGSPAITTTELKRRIARVRNSAARWRGADFLADSLWRGRLAHALTGLDKHTADYIWRQICHARPTPPYLTVLANQLHNVGHPLHNGVIDASIRAAVSLIAEVKLGGVGPASWARPHFVRFAATALTVWCEWSGRTPKLSNASRAITGYWVFEEWLNTLLRGARAAPIGADILERIVRSSLKTQK